MTADDYAILMDFLATRFARMDAGQEAIEARLTRSEVLWESTRDDVRRVAEGVMAVNERLDRFQSEMRERLEEHDRRFDRIESRLEEHDRRFDRIESRLEEHDRRFDNIDVRVDKIDRGIGGIQVQFDRFAVDFGTVQLDHGARIEALERHRRRRDSGG